MHRLPSAQEFEDRFTAYVQSINGHRVDHLVPVRPELPKLADYVLFDRTVIAELKCITTDHLSSPSIGKHLADLLRASVSSGAIGPANFQGNRVIFDERVSLALRRQAVDQLARPLKKLSAYASKQIRSTASEMSIESFHGLLVLVNLADQRLAPEIVHTLLSRALKDHAKSVHFVAFYSPHIGVQLPDGRRPTLLMTAMNGQQPQERMEQVNRLMEGWLKFNDGVFLDD